MLLELAIGDAYGAGFEYCYDNLTSNNLEEYVQNSKHRDLKPGKYTDDAQMSIAIAESILNSETNELFVPETWVKYFLNIFHRDWRQGYSRNFQKFLEITKSSEDFLNNIRPDSSKSGAAMRSCPIGYIRDIEQLLKIAKIQATTTHNTDIGIRSSQIVALACNFFIHQDGKIGNLKKFLEQYISLSDFHFDWNQEVLSQGTDSVSAALTSIIRNNSISELLIECVNYTGDVDTVACIALGIASCSKEYIFDLPDQLVWGLECGGKFGKEYLEKLDSQLKDKFIV